MSAATSYCTSKYNEALHPGLLLRTSIIYNYKLNCDTGYHRIGLESQVIIPDATASASAASRSSIRVVSASIN